MAELSRFDVAEFGGIMMVVVESDLLLPDASVVVIPLFDDYPAVRLLNPEIKVDGRTLVLATRLKASGVPILAGDRHEHS